jgi:hypothetical protein
MIKVVGFVISHSTLVQMGTCVEARHAHFQHPGPARSINMILAVLHLQERVILMSLRYTSEIDTRAPKMAVHDLVLSELTKMIFV